MHLQIDNSMLLAQNLGDGFRKFSQGSQTSSDYMFLFIVLGILVAGAVGLYIWDRRRTQSVREAETGESLFRELCNEHRLTRPERDLLMRCLGSGDDRLEQPALVFADPTILRRYAERAGADSKESRSLANKLYGR
ncbi:MAG: hypothetical protein AB7O26_06090 [Planctomycetaceae bacterium]